MLIISIIVLFMSSVEWKWQWFLLSVIESRYFYDSERFQMQWARTAQGVCTEKSCALLGQKRLLHCRHFSFSFSLLNCESPCLKLPKSEQARPQVQMSHWPGFSQCPLSHRPLLANCSSLFFLSAIQTRPALLQGLLSSPADGGKDRHRSGWRWDGSREGKPQVERPWNKHFENLRFSP